MWKYLILNSLWFAILFLVIFFGNKKSQRFILLSLLGFAAVMVFQPAVDPLTWSCYVTFSLLVFWSAFQFKRWALAPLKTLDEEARFMSGKLESRCALLSEKTHVTQAIGRKANEISLLFEKIKEMSQSLDGFETFLIFGEALSKNFKFHLIKLAVYNHEESEPAKPDEFYQLVYSDFQGIFDRMTFLKDKKRAKAELFLSDKKIFELLFKSHKLLVVLDSLKHRQALGLGPDFPSFSAHPILINKRMTAILMIIGMSEKDIPILSILTERFISEVRRIKLYEHVETLAITDGLTGVYVRRHLAERLEGEMDRAKRFGVKLSFLMIDIDDFKHFNDHYGHLVGDVVLRQVAETIQKNIREVDLAGRYGGEEFGVLLVETDEAGAFYVAERIRRAVSEKSFKAYDENLKVSVSIGCSQYTPALNDAGLLVDAADSALYQAKRQGKNRVCVSGLSQANGAVEKP